jgi:Zn-dependent protease with chaperone function
VYVSPAAAPNAFRDGSQPAQRRRLRDGRLLQMLDRDEIAGVMATSWRT